MNQESRNKLDVRLKQGYSEMGAKPFAEEFGVSKRYVNKRANRMGLKISKTRKSKIQKENGKTLQTILKKTNQKNLHLARSININSPEFAYFLGFVWGDGYMYHPRGQRWYCKIEIVVEDSYLLKDILNVLNIDFYSQTRKRKNRKEQICITIKDPVINFFLFLNSFSRKSVAPPKIIDKVPEELKGAFLLGLSDADGCWYYNAKNYLRQFSLCGPFDYNWVPILSILKEKEIICPIIRRQGNKGNSSIIRITGKENLKKLYDLLYSSRIKGLKRKEQKARICRGEAL